jgi:coenzyme F420 hydrogenase subunit beta
MNCATCYIVCPKTNLFRQVKVTHERIFSARSAKKDVLAATKQGGVATSLLIYALDNDIIDCAIMMVDYNPILATKPEEIMKAKGIKFGISPNLSLLSEAIEMGYNKIALVGVPCNVIAARNLQFMGLRELKVILGIFCPRGSHPKKKTKACKFCKDLTAESSDVSIGSLGSQKGWRTVIVRTEVGEKLVKGAILQNYIQIKDIDEEGLDKIVKMSKKKKEAGNKEGEE